jgi:hypothetical protein
MTSLRTTAKRRVGRVEYELSRLSGDMARRARRRAATPVRGDLADVTAVTVVCRTKDLFKIAYGSFRRFYPDVPLLVVNGLAGDECTSYVESAQKTDHNLRLIKFRHNIGHGRGMHVALQRVATPYAYIFDSDTRTDAPVLEPMLERASRQGDFYAVGIVMDVDRRGRNTYLSEAQPGVSIAYAHPAVMLLNLKQYWAHQPFFEHGAPALNAMVDLHDAGRSDLLIDFPVADYVHHEWSGTRKVTKRYMDLGSTAQC